MRAAMTNVVLIAILLIAFPLQAGVDTILAHGVQPNSTYQVSEFDSVKASPFSVFRSQLVISECPVNIIASHGARHFGWLRPGRRHVLRARALGGSRGRTAPRAPPV